MMLRVVLCMMAFMKMIKLNTLNIACADVDAASGFLLTAVFDTSVSNAGKIEITVPVSANDVDTVVLLCFDRVFCG